MSVAVFQNERRLQGKFVFLSASKPSRNFELFPLAPGRQHGTSLEIDEAVLSLARAVFSAGGRLVFGGHPSISPLVASVAAEYFPARRIPPGQEPVWIYQSKAFRTVIDRSTASLESLGYARIHWVTQYGEEQYSKELAGQEQCLNSLRLMRERMIALSLEEPVVANLPPQVPVAMVAIGGMEGVLREARMFLEKTNGQIFVLRSTAGAAKSLSNYLRTNVLREETSLRLPDWERRVSFLEDLYPSTDWNSGGEGTDKPQLPLAPYAVLMQNMVLRITGQNPRQIHG